MVGEELLSSVFHRTTDPLQAVSASGCWITDASGRRFLDAAGGAIVTGIGHGRAEIADVIAEQMRKVEFVHASVFTTEALETYCDSVASLVPVTGAKVYPVAGGSEATETALKMARAYQLARGREQRTRVLAREGSYHGNSLGALDLSGRPALRGPYEPWLGRFAQVPGIDDPGAVPHPDYWSAVAEICRRHDVLLIADEVMTGFGRTGKWFGLEHWGVAPDLMTTGKGASSGYWPLGHAIASGSVFETIRATFVHGFTFSHHPVGAAVGQAVLDIIRREGLVEAARAQGEKLRTALAAITSDRIVEIRGKGLLLGVVLTGNRDRVVRAAREEGLLVYPAAIEAVVLGPPLTIDDREIDQIADRLGQAIAR
ncbi:MAG: aspartate aminotransferase family protein [Acidimicrobiia bacterium]